MKTPYAYFHINTYNSINIKLKGPQKIKGRDNNLLLANTVPKD